MKYIIKVKTKSHESFYERQGNVAPGAKQMTSFVCKKEDAYKFSDKDEANFVKNYLKFTYSYDAEVVADLDFGGESYMPKIGTVFIFNDKPYIICSHEPKQHVDGELYIDHSKSIFCINELGKVILWGRNDDYYNYLKTGQINILWQPS